jgi:hypothetical protein
MSGSSAAPTPPLSLAEMQVLVARAGLTLNPGQMADLVLAWRQVVGLLKSIRVERPMLDDQAFVFRLPPPAADSKPSGAPRKQPAGPRAGKTAARPRASKKATAPRAKKKVPARKTVRRR